MKKVKTCLHCDKIVSVLHHVVRRTEEEEIGSCNKCHEENVQALREGYAFIV